MCPSFGGTDGETNAKIVYHDPEHDTHVTEPPSLSTRETASTGDSGRESYTSTLPYYGSTIQGDSVTYDDEPLLDNCREEGAFGKQPETSRKAIDLTVDTGCVFS